MSSINRSTRPSISALDGVGGQRHVPAALPPGKTLYPLYRRVGGPQGWSGRVWKIGKFGGGVKQWPCVRRNETWVFGSNVAVLSGRIPLSVSYLCQTSYVI